MPWKISDVDSHKSGLSAKEKRKWVAIANSALKSCMDDGGEEESCAVSAIKQANGSTSLDDNVSTEIVESISMEVYTESVIAYQIRHQMLDGKRHLIVPVVMMVEGVHHGSQGPLLYTAEDLSKFPSSWDGIPVTIGHPEIDEEYVSANSPEVLAQSVGRIFNTCFEDGKLKAEVWIDEQRITAISPTALAYIVSGRQLEVSVGVFTEHEEVSGTYINANNNEEEEYIAIARNHRPDHLALLPGMNGACSWNDGCGIRVNSSETSKLNVNEDMNDEQVLAKKQLALENCLASLTNNEQGYQELMMKLSSKLDALDNDQAYYMLEEVYEDHIIYRKRARGNGETGFYQQSYQINVDDSVELTNEPKRVRRDVSYVAVNAVKRTNFNNKKGEPKMAEKVDVEKPCCLEKVVELIANKLTNFTEEDREWLLELGPEKLERLTPKAPEVVKVVEAEKAPAVNMAEYVKKDSLKTTEDFLAIAPAEMRDQLRSGLRLHQNYRSELIANVLTNSQEGAWTEEELKEEDTARLEKLSKQFKAPVDFSAKGAGQPLSVNKEEDEEILLPVGIKIE